MNYLIHCVDYILDHVMEPLSQKLIRKLHRILMTDTVLEMICSTYYELNCNADTDEVKQAFDELYQAMTGKTLKEKDEVIYATCRLCSLHQQTGFVDGIRLGLKLSQELNN